MEAVLFILSVLLRAANRFCGGWQVGYVAKGNQNLMHFRCRRCTIIPMERKARSLCVPSSQVSVMLGAITYDIRVLMHKLYRN